MAINLLSAAQCKSATCEGRSVRKLSDGGGLYLCVHAEAANFGDFITGLPKRKNRFLLVFFPPSLLKTFARSVMNSASDWHKP